MTDCTTFTTTTKHFLNTCCDVMSGPGGEVLRLNLKDGQAIRNALREKPNVPLPRADSRAYGCPRLGQVLQFLDQHNRVLYFYGTPDVLITWPLDEVLARVGKLPPPPENLTQAPKESAETHAMLAGQYRELTKAMQKTSLTCFVEFPWQFFWGTFHASPADLRGITMAHYSVCNGLRGERLGIRARPWKRLRREASTSS